MLAKQRKVKNKADSREEDFAAIRKALVGNEQAYEFLQKKYRKVVASLIRRMVKDEDDIDDLTQETFIKAFGSLDSFKFNYSFSSWIYRIASNNCIDFLRRKRFATISISQPIGDGDEEHTFEIKDVSYQPDTSYMQDERQRILFEAIDKLPENYRQIIKLRHEEDLDYKDIADQLDLPLGTVKAHLFRARKILLTELKKHAGLFQD